MALGVAMGKDLVQVVGDQGASPFIASQRVYKLRRHRCDLGDLAEREAVHAELRVVERHAQPAVAGELQGVRLDDVVLRLVVHDVLDDLARVLATVLDQPVQLGDCLVLVHCQHCVSSFSAPTYGAVVMNRPICRLGKERSSNLGMSQ
jgi:hypothetical protein